MRAEAQAKANVYRNVCSLVFIKSMSSSLNGFLLRRSTPFTAPALPLENILILRNVIPNQSFAHKALFLFVRHSNRIISTVVKKAGQKNAAPGDGMSAFSEPDARNAGVSRTGQEYR